MEVHRSARKHGVDDVDVVQAATSYLLAIPLDTEDDQDDGAPREMRLGFDTAGRLLEVVVLLLDEDREMAVHAMKARSKYMDLL